MTQSATLCIPTIDDCGRDARLSAHFGKAPYYTVVETSDNRVEVHANGSDHFDGAQRPPQFVASLGIDAVVVDELGRQSLVILTDHGINVYRATAETVDDIVEAFKHHTVQALTTDDVHPSGHHRHE